MKRGVRPVALGPAVVLVTVIGLCPGSRGQGVDVKDLLGRRVVTTSTTPLKVGGTLIEKDGRFRVYLVDRVNPRQVHIAAGRINAWVAPGQVVLFDQAEAYFTERLRRQPRDGGLYNKRGLIRHERHEYDQAIADFDKAIELDRNYPLAYNNRGCSRQAKGELDAAMADFDKAIELDPKLALAYHNRGSANQARGDLERALADYDRAIQLDPLAALSFNDRGWAYYQRRQYDAALADWDRAIELDPQAVTHSNRGLAWQAKGAFEKALADFDKAVELDPAHALAYANRAVLRTDCPDPRYRNAGQAVADATRACELTEWKDPRYLRVLAAARAAAGNRDRDGAATAGDQAVEAAPPDRDEASRPRLQPDRAGHHPERASDKQHGLGTRT